MDKGPPQPAACRCGTYCAHRGYPDPPLQRGFYCRDGKTIAEAAADSRKFVQSERLRAVLALLTSVRDDGRGNAMVMHDEAAALLAEREELQELLRRAIAGYEHIGVVSGIDKWLERAKKALKEK